MKVLVTGHKGFIGTRLCEKLKELKHEIVGIDVREGTDILEALEKVSQTQQGIGIIM